MDLWCSYVKKIQIKLLNLASLVWWRLVDKKYGFSFKELLPEINMAASVSEALEKQGW